MSFEIIPAIDLRGGRVVRLKQGDFACETGYAVDPGTLACAYAEAGARWLHVVDLDGARSGNPGNLRTIQTLTQSSLWVQAGGGVRCADDVRRLIDLGVERIVVGSLAVREPECVIGWLDDFGPERLVVALDARFDGACWRLPTSGWTATGTATLDELAPHYAAAGMRYLLCTDIDRDGMLTGPNLALYAHLARIAPGLAVQASGGVRDATDVVALRACAAGVILGRSLLEGRLTVAEALAC